MSSCHLLELASLLECFIAYIVCLVQYILMPFVDYFVVLAAADIILWRNKQMSGGILAGVTIIWLLFEWMGYHLLTCICHSLIFLLAVSFIWFNAASIVNR